MALGRKTGGRKKGSRNKRKLAEEAAKTVVPPPASPVVIAPIVRPQGFDPLDQLEIIAKQFLHQAAVEQGKGADGDRKFFNECLERAARVIKDISPYRHPRLGSLEHKFLGMDLSKLTDVELATFNALVARVAVTDQGGTGETTH